MEFLTYIGTLKALKMIVLSNMFRGGHPQQHLGTKEVNSSEEKSENNKIPKLVTQSSLRLKQRTNRQHKTDINDGEKQEMEEMSMSEREKRLSTSVDAIITKRDLNSKVICSAKGLLETNLDDLFNDVQKLDAWADEPKSLGTSEPTLSFSDKRQIEINKRESLVSEDDTADDTATDSDCLDEVVREQRKCMGARRLGHMLRRVISRNGKMTIEYSFLNLISFFFLKQNKKSNYDRPIRCWLGAGKWKRRRSFIYFQLSQIASPALIEAPL